MSPATARTAATTASAGCWVRESLEKVEGEMNMVAEGVANSVSLYECVKQRGIEAPIIEQAYLVIHDGKAPAEALAQLLSRDPRPEADEA